MNEKYKGALESFAKLLEIMDTLREKCPWDRKQTNLSLKPNTIEEVYELAQAIEDNDTEDIKKELGDLLLHIVFYAKIGQEKNQFDVKSVIDSLCEKLIRRHPHIYGERVAETADDVRKTWEQIKLTEGRKGVLSGVPRGLESIIKAYRLQEKAAGVGFDWENAEDTWSKVEEEIGELKDEVAKAENKERISEEFGDLLFAMINYARKMEINPSHSLEQTNKKFIQRFEYIEQVAESKGISLTDMSLEQMEELWQRAKTEKKS
mgnify:FL=1